MMEAAVDPAFRPFSAKVEAMAGYGLSAADIACVLALDEDDLRSDYQRDLDSGAIKANLRVAESLYRQALGDGRQAVTAAIFWLKTRARWKETSVHEVVAPAMDLTAWTDEQLDAEIKRLDEQIAAARGRIESP
jgi:hypothetical protein